jgi:hypothetical protein
VRALAALCAAALASACAGAPGPGGVALSAAPATVSAGGRSVVVAPPPGRCLTPHHAEDGATVVAALGCDGAGPLAGISVGAARLFDDGAREDGLLALEQWARSPAARRELGMEGGGAARAVEIGREDGALFVLVEDPDADEGPRRFWRVFAEINGRLTMISVYDLPGERHGDGALRAAAETHLASLRRANPETAAAGAAAPIRRPPRPRPAA